ncbi:MAG: tetratricopeptide repeat protein [Leptolyngbya sp. IPPAS B-1204]|nr:MAG: Tfp pilus assembly protein PilF [Leptolyngbya sp. IPPAS B-1204]
MSNKRNRWLTGLVMAIGVLAFVGFSIILPFSGAFQQSQKPAGSATPSPRPSGSPSADLEAQAKGYELVLQREPDNQTALRGLVETRIQQGKLEELLPPLQKLADLNPDQPDYTVLLAQTKQRLGDREAAAELYRSTLAKHPGNINALKGLSDLLIEQDRPEAAIGLLQDTIKTADEANKAQPGSVDVVPVQLLLGEVYARQDRFEEAMAIYDQAAQVNQQDFRPILGKALVLKAQGKTEEAKPLFTSAAALAPAQFKDQINKLAALPSPSPAPASPAAENSPAPEPSPAPAEPAPQP